MEDEMEEDSFLIVKVFNLSENLVEQGNFDFLFLRAELKPQLGKYQKKFAKIFTIMLPLASLLHFAAYFYFIFKNKKNNLLLARNLKDSFLNL